MWLFKQISPTYLSSLWIELGVELVSLQPHKKVVIVACLDDWEICQATKIVLSSNVPWWTKPSEDKSELHAFELLKHSVPWTSVPWFDVGLWNWSLLNVWRLSIYIYCSISKFHDTDVPETLRISHYVLFRETTFFLGFSGNFMGSLCPITNYFIKAKIMERMHDAQLAWWTCMGCCWQLWFQYF